MYAQSKVISLSLEAMISMQSSSVGQPVRGNSQWLIIGAYIRLFELYQPLKLAATQCKQSWVLPGHLSSYNTNKSRHLRGIFVVNSQHSFLVISLCIICYYMLFRTLNTSIVYSKYKLQQSACNMFDKMLQWDTMPINIPALT